MTQAPLFGGRTIGQSFSSRHNSLNFIRLVLALMVLVSHAGGLGGFKHTAFVINGTSLATIAVYCFFGISGFLITGSVVRNRPGRYLWQRFLRIFPGFWICLLVTALFFGVLAWFSHPAPHCGLACYFTANKSPFGYLYRNWLLPSSYSAQFSIAGTPRGVAYPLVWDGPLWTLFYEFLCYLLLAALAILGLVRRRILTLVVASCVWLAVLLITTNPPWDNQFNALEQTNSVIMNLLKFASIFFMGAVIYLYRERIPDSGWLALACATLFVAWLLVPTQGRSPDGWFTVSDLLVPLVAYPVIWLGIHLPLQKIGSKNDYSYGIYIYAWPVTQLLAIAGVQKLGYVPFLLVSVLATAPVAVASWWFVEKQALSLKKLDATQLARGLPWQRAKRGSYPSEISTEAVHPDSESDPLKESSHIAAPAER
jgi:peptidoglycan/LPS O-acetylase OafA/YrhL